MIDKKDAKTVDAFPVKKRGRPSTGHALTPAERKQLQRDRDAIRLREAKFPADYSEITTTALLEGLAAAVSGSNQAEARKIANELVKRAKFP